MRKHGCSARSATARAGLRLAVSRSRSSRWLSGVVVVPDAGAEPSTARRAGTRSPQTKTARHEGAPFGITILFAYWPLALDAAGAVFRQALMAFL